VQEYDGTYEIVDALPTCEIYALNLVLSRETALNDAALSGLSYNVSDQQLIILSCSQLAQPR
jgi:hypothetical protein